ncbi:MAG: hypothetical protein DRG59_02240 [Deltaproteobacteria bacterium]|nr:MAG: hypothetical protein DRG59_02240 [Deltaproteobacteria bacterium]
MFYAERCDFCGECLSSCQYLDYDEERAQKEMKELVEGGCPPVVANCVTCVACNQVCPNGANPFDLINERQEETGALSIPKESFEKFAQLHNLPSKVVSGDPEKPAMNLCIVGNMVKDQVAGSLFSGLTLVEGADYFCTLGYVHLGKPSIVKENISKFVENLAALEKDEVICFHDDCYATLKAKADECHVEVPFKVTHLFEYLAEQLKERQNEIKPLGLKVAYQAPCASRYSPEKDVYLDEIFDLVGVKRVSRKHEGMKGLCCGAPLMAKDRERAMKIKLKNIEDAAEHGAEAMIFLCPMCFLNLRKLCRERNIRPIFISDLCYYALGEKEY